MIAGGGGGCTVTDFNSTPGYKTTVNLNSWAQHGSIVSMGGGGISV